MISANEGERESTAVGSTIEFWRLIPGNWISPKQNDPFADRESRLWGLREQGDNTFSNAVAL